MGIHIGNRNKITHSNIVDNIDTYNESQTDNKKRTIYEKHPVICGFLISLIAGIVLLFSFWGKFIDFIERVI